MNTLPEFSKRRFLSLLTFILLASIFLVHRSRFTPISINETQSPPTLAFSPNRLTSPLKGTVDVNITLNTNSYSFQAIGLAITYNPKELELVSVDPGPSLPHSAMEPISGSGSYAVAYQTEDSSGFQGQGVVAGLKLRLLSSPTTLTINPISSGYTTDSQQLSLLPASTLTLTIPSSPPPATTASDGLWSPSPSPKPSPKPSSVVSPSPTPKPSVKSSPTPSPATSAKPDSSPSLISQIISKLSSSPSSTPTPPPATTASDGLWSPSPSPKPSPKPSPAISHSPSSSPLVQDPILIPTLAPSILPPPSPAPFSLWKFLLEFLKSLFS